MSLNITVVTIILKSLMKKLKWDIFDVILNPLLFIKIKN